MLKSTAKDRRAIFLFGPTAAGKTNASLTLAKRFNGEIINTDSRQIYQEMPIITAMPSEEEFASAPHHLFSFLAPDVAFSVKDWLDAATERAESIWARGRTPIFVGGTGLYFRALEKGLSVIPPVPQGVLDAFQERATLEGLNVLYQELLIADPLWASMIEPTDAQRILRGLSVLKVSGKPLSAWQKMPRVGALQAQITKLAISPPADVLRARIEKRYHIMVKEGVLEEAKYLYEKYLKNLDKGQIIPPAFKSIGLGDYSNYFKGQCSVEEAHKAVVMQMCRYAKRQRTWLRNSFGQAQIFEDAEALIASIEEI